MGHKLSDWQVKVRALVRVASRREVATDRIEAVGLRPAFMRFSGDRPRQMIEEAAGAGSAYFDLPDGWVPGVSHLDRIEQPARQVPPSYLDDKAWLVVRSPSDVTVEQILLAVSPSSGTFVRFAFTAPWPYPTNEIDEDSKPVVDQVDDLAFEAVASLAASYVITSLENDGARRRMENAAPADAKAGGIPDESLLKTAQAYEAIYLRYLGIDPTTPGTTSIGPFSMTVDYDPQTDAIFHGGPR